MRLQKAGRRCALALAAATAALRGAGSAAAVSIALVNATPAPPITVGETVVVQLTVSDLGAAPNATSLTAFELEISYDEALLDFVSVSFEPFLGIELENASNEPCTFANLDGVCDVILAFASSSGLVELAETSLWAPGEINTYQPASGVLATLTFTAQGVGSVTLSPLQVSLTGTVTGEQEGTLSGTATSLTLSIVPEPGTSLLVALGCAGLAAGARRRALRARSSRARASR